MASSFRSGLFAVLLAAPAFAGSLDDERAAFDRRFEAAQPRGEGAAIWALDWEDRLSTALVRAKRERRPVLFIHVTNITGPSNFASGHC